MHGFYVLHNDFVMYPFPEFFMLCYYWPLPTSVDQAHHFNCFENWVSYDSVHNPLLYLSTPVVGHSLVDTVFLLWQTILNGTHQQVGCLVIGPHVFPCKAIISQLLP